MNAIKNLWCSNIGDKPREFDFGQGYGETWEYFEASRCEKCNKIVTGIFGESQHSDCEDTDCDGYVHSDGPMMNYCYPIHIEDANEAVKLIVDLPLVIVQFTDDDGYYLALSGGGMDLSWEICEAYMRLNQLPPTHFCNLPQISGKGISKKDKWIIAGCRKSLTVANRQNYRTLKSLRQNYSNKKV
jgi:hypothetical protein